MIDAEDCRKRLQWDESTDEEVHFGTRRFVFRYVPSSANWSGFCATQFEEQEVMLGVFATVFAAAAVISAIILISDDFDGSTSP